MAELACQAVRKDGQPCRAPAQPGASLCLWHDPDRAEAAREARSRGAVAAGKVRALQARRAKLDTPRALVRFVAGVVQDVLDGQVEVDAARAALYGVNVQRLLLEQSDIEARLTALEQRLADQQGGRRWGT